MAPDTLYENRPGGTIVRLADGTHEQVLYGTAYDGKYAPEKLADITREGLSAHADSTPRTSQEDAQIAMARDAHRRSALDANGQVNSSQSPVPSNYNDLDEDAAAILVMNLARYPEQQASIVMHEILYGGNRRKVIDAAGEYAHIAAQARIAALLPSQDPESIGEPPSAPSAASPGDPGVLPGDNARSVEYEARAAAALGAQSIKSGLGRSQAPSSQVEPGPEPGDTPADEAAHKAAEARLAEREDLLDRKAAQLEELQARLEQQLANPQGPPSVSTATVEGTGGTGVPEDRRTAPDGGDATGWDGASGVGSEGYWTNEDLKGYAEQHDVDVSGASNREQLKSKLAAGGHPDPQTPKP